MEEIKFRAWNHMKEDWEDSSFDADLDEDENGTTPNLYIVNTMYSEGNNGSLYTYQLATGKLDKNGKEIYEGDIVVCHPERKYGRRVVKVDLYNGFNNGEGGDFEIIGNVFEHPELMSGRHEA